MDLDSFDRILNSGDKEQVVMHPQQQDVMEDITVEPPKSPLGSAPLEFVLPPPTPEYLEELNDWPIDQVQPEEEAQLEQPNVDAFVFDEATFETALSLTFFEDLMNDPIQFNPIEC